MKKEYTANKRSKKLGIEGLSTLEADILNIVWQHKKTTVREVHEAMLEEGYIPHTTVLAAMNNMALKGLLKQNRDSSTYMYSAAISRDATAEAIVDAVVSKILNNDPTLLIQYFLKNMSEEEIKKLLY